MTQKSQTAVFDTIAALVAERAKIGPREPALIDEAGGIVCYEALAEQVTALAADIVALVGTADGTRPRVGIVLPNGPELAVTLLATSIAGEATPFNPALTSAEFERYFANTGIQALIVSEYDTGASAVASALDLPVLRVTHSRRIAGARNLQHVAPQSPRPSDVAMVLMTSGSTGVPKVVPLSHQNVCTSAADVARSVGLTSQDRCLVMWQQFHIGGLVDLLLAPLSVGSGLIVTSGLAEQRFFELTKRLEPTWFQGVPTTLGALAKYADLQGIETGKTSLRFIRSVAAALTPELQNRLAKLFGVPIIRTFGMTEASPLITSTALPPVLDKPGSVGRPCGTQVRICGLNMTNLGTGEPGEVAIRGPNVFAGYENNAEANSTAFREGWFITGDIGYFDTDGDLFLVGRAKEQINRGGYKIMPAEVEEALSRHPAVQESAVFGLAHTTLGEDIAAAVSLKPGANVSAATLRVFLSEFLAAHKVPSRITIMENLPRNPVGKLDRLAMAQTAAAELDSQARLAQPRTEMERFLSGLWARELSLPVLGIHQNFMEVGGDSLSALRILVAMETTLGSPVSEDRMASFSTIAEMAAELTAAGYNLTSAEGADADLAAEQALDRTTIGTEVDMTPDAFCALVSEASSTSVIDAAFEGLTTYATPEQIRAALKISDANEVGAGALMLIRYLVRRRYRRESDRLLQEIAAAEPSVMSWTRKDLSPSALHFTHPFAANSQKTLIVGFTGKLMRLQLPTYRLLLELEPSRFDLVLLRDPAQKLYANGLPGMGDTVLELGAWLDAFATKMGYAHRIAFGTSGGGLAAIHTAMAYHWDRVVASSPPSPSVYADLGQSLRSLAVNGAESNTQIVIAYSQNARDMDCAREVLGILPKARPDFHDQFTSHNLLNSADAAGVLPALIENWFAIN